MLSEEQVKNILGEFLFEECISFFEEMYDRHSEYKIILTRRCFSLFKVFKPILKNRGIKNQHGIIITDNAIDFYLDDIKRVLINPPQEGAASVIIVDDIIIYGRTINTILNKLLETTVSNAIRVMCLFQSTRSCILEKYTELILTRYGVSSLEWKEYSSIFSRLIKTSNVANTSYIISAFLNQNGKSMQRFIRTVREHMICTTTSELQKCNVESYVIACEASKGLCGLFKTIIGGVRIYIYNNLESVVISPLLILEKLSETELTSVINMIVKLYCNETKRNQVIDMDMSCKMRFLSLLLSHALLRDFLLQNEIASNDIVGFDSEEIITYNFIPDLLDVFNNFDEKALEKQQNVFVYTTDGILTDYTELENYVFEMAMSDNNLVVNNPQRRQKGFAMIHNISIFAKKYLAGFLTMIDSGIAALRTHYSVEEQGVSLAYPGEQAFRIMSNKYQNLLPAMSALENLANVYSKDCYELFRNFCAFVSEKNSNLLSKAEYDAFLVYLNILQKNGQQISDVMFIDKTEQNTKKCGIIIQMLNLYAEEVLDSGCINCN